MSTHYETLGVAERADESEIKRAWARLVRQHTPDQDPEGNRRLNEAKSTLLDPLARADYDAQIQFGDEITDLFDQGRSAMAEEDYESAIQLFKEILAFHPGSLDARNQLALAHVYSGEHYIAAKHLQRLVEAAPESALYASNLGHVYKEWGDDEPSMLEQSETWLRRATELESFNASHHIALSRLYRVQKRYFEAEQAIESAIGADGKVDTDDVDSLMELPWVYLFSNQKDKIANVAERVKAILPDDDEARQYASFLFVRTAAELASEYLAYQDASYFIRAARRISGDLGDAEEAANGIERLALIEKQSEQMKCDKTIQPAVMPNLLAALVCSRVGVEFDDDYVESLLAAAASWSQTELRSAAQACRQKYPDAYFEVQDKVEQIIGLGQLRTLTDSNYQSPRASGGGCVVLILTLIAVVTITAQL